MKRALALPAVALLALTGCGPSEEEQALRDAFDCEDGESMEECGERNADEMMEGAPTSVSDEAADDTGAAADEPESEGDDETLAPKDRDFSDDPLLADREFTGRMTGDVVAGLGEPVEIDQGSFDGIGDYMGTLTLDEIYAAPECETSTGEIVEPEGELLVATFTITADEAADSEFYVSHGDFRWVGHDADIAYYEMFDCTDAVNPTSASVRPGETAERTFVFDIPEFEGALSYTDATNYVDWEIERSDYDNADRLPESANDNGAADAPNMDEGAEAAPEPVEEEFTEDTSPHTEEAVAEEPAIEESQQYTGERPLTEEEMNSMSDIEAHCADMNGQYTIIGNSYYEVMGDPSAEAEVEAELDALSAEMEAAGCYDLHY